LTGCPELYADVLIDLRARRIDRRLTYRVPESLRDAVGVGLRVLVPLGPRLAHGFVLGLHPGGPTAQREIREILQITNPHPFFSPRLLDLAEWVAADTLSTLAEAVHCLVPSAAVARSERAPSSPAARSDPDPDSETARRPPARARLLGESCAVPAGRPTLLWGEERARRSQMLEQALAVSEAGGQVIITVPEIALVPDLLRKAAAVLGGRVAQFHSGMRDRDRRAAWARIAAQEAPVVVGTRSALFAPLACLRLIAVDQEEDAAYKAEAAPRYHAREVALKRAELDGARVILGSASPSVEVFAAVADGRIGCVRLPPAEPSRAVAVVDMRAERRLGRRGILSQPLVMAMRRHLRAGGRVALFVQGGGYARILRCRECGHTVRCARCEVTMPYDRETRRITCRICGQAVPAPSVCPRCGGVALRWIGAGTERVEEIARRLFPSLGIARLDRETEKQFARVAAEFMTGRTRLLVGTQLLLRARRIRPTLIGVVDADLPLFLPDFRAGERALQQLRALASLASDGPGAEAVFQTRAPDHPVIAALLRGTDEQVYARELEVRREFGYPPYTVLAVLLAVGNDPAAAWGLAVRAAEIARRSGAEVLGPAPDRDSGPKGAFRYRCLLRSSDGAVVRSAARAAMSAGSLGKSRLVVEMNP
jgi:primosomal protein N' (replication factor Y) (superfamily II helicase)